MTRVFIEDLHTGYTGEPASTKRKPIEAFAAQLEDIVSETDGMVELIVNGDWLHAANPNIYNPDVAAYQNIPLASVLKQYDTRIAVTVLPGNWDLDRSELNITEATDEYYQEERETIPDWKNVLRKKIHSVLHSTDNTICIRTPGFYYINNNEFISHGHLHLPSTKAVIMQTLGMQSRKPEDLTHFTRMSSMQACDVQQYIENDQSAHTLSDFLMHSKNAIPFLQQPINRFIGKNIERSLACSLIYGVLHSDFRPQSIIAGHTHYPVIWEKDDFAPLIQGVPYAALPQKYINVGTLTGHTSVHGRSSCTYGIRTENDLNIRLVDLSTPNL